MDTSLSTSHWAISFNPWIDAYFSASKLEHFFDLHFFLRNGTVLLAHRLKNPFLSLNWDITC